MTKASVTRTYSGGCHCGAVRFEVDAPVPVELWRCNCSICGMTGYEHLIVPSSGFRLLSGREQLRSYPSHATCWPMASRRDIAHCARQSPHTWVHRVE